MVNILDHEIYRGIYLKNLIIIYDKRKKNTLKYMSCWSLNHNNFVKLSKKIVLTLDFS